MKTLPTRLLGLLRYPVGKRHARRPVTPRAGLVVVTGASSGIGTQLARAFAGQGFELLLVARNEQRLSDVAQVLRREFRAQADYRSCDLTVEAQRAALVVELGKRPIAVLCCNAGVGSFGAFVELDAQALQRQVELNVVATHALCRAVLPGMVRRHQGAVLITGSTAGNQPVPGAATYAATKAFVNSLAESLHCELRGTGVTCSLVTPGPVRTNFARRSHVQAAADRVPSFAFVDAEKVARTAVRALVLGRRRASPGIVGRLLGLGGRLTPRWALLPATRRAVMRFASFRDRN